MITIIAGTNRRDSQSGKVARQVEKLHREAGATTALLDLSELPEGCLSPDAYAAKPEVFERDFVAPVLAADGLVLVVPEYNGSFPGVLKLFIDLLPFPEAFEKRPTCFVGLAAGQWGALRAVEQLQMIFGYRNAFNFNQRVFLPGVGGLLSEGGEITDKEILQRLDRQAAAFRDFVTAIKELR